MNNDGKPDILVASTRPAVTTSCSGTATARSAPRPPSGRAGRAASKRWRTWTATATWTWSCAGPFGTENSGIAVFWGTGTGRVPDDPDRGPGPGPGPGRAAAVGDFNRDGLLDVAAAVSNAAGTSSASPTGPERPRLRPGPRRSTFTQPIGLVGRRRQRGRRGPIWSARARRPTWSRRSWVIGGRLPDGTHSASAWLEDVAGNRSPPGPSGLVHGGHPAADGGPWRPQRLRRRARPPYTFTVTYADANGVDVTSLGNGNLLVTGPNGFSQAATLVSVNPPGNGSPRTATYRDHAAGRLLGLRRLRGLRRHAQAGAGEGPRRRTRRRRPRWAGSAWASRRSWPGPT